MYKKILLGLALVGLLIIAPLAMGAFDAPTESASWACCGDACSCEDCTCDADGCSCNTGGDCSCDSDCCSSCCAD